LRALAAGMSAPTNDRNSVMFAIDVLVGAASQQSRCQPAEDCGANA
jgi:hypothetical protein